MLISYQNQEFHLQYPALQIRHLIWYMVHNTSINRQFTQKVATILSPPFPIYPKLSRFIFRIVFGFIIIVTFSTSKYIILE